MTMTDQQRKIVQHFARHVPAEKRPQFETLAAKALKALNVRENISMRTTAACLDVMKHLSRRVEEC